MPKFSDTRVKVGGLMRCCDATIAEYVDEHKDEEALGAFTLDCKYEPAGNGQVFFDGSVWAWAGTEEERVARHG